jgi:hypothetical protein
LKEGRIQKVAAKVCRLRRTADILLGVKALTTCTIVYLYSLCLSCPHAASFHPAHYLLFSGRNQFRRGGGGWRERVRDRRGVAANKRHGERVGMARWAPGGVMTARRRAWR